MNQMSRDIRNAPESIYLALAIVPLFLVGALLGFGVLRERLARAEVNATVARFHEGVSQPATERRPIDNHWMTERFDARTSKKNSTGWRDVFAATNDLGARFGNLMLAVEGLDDLVPHGSTWDAEAIADRYVDEGKPILEAIARLTTDPQPVAQPLLFSGFGTLLGDLQDSRGTVQLLEKEFQVAVHDGDQPRALRALESMRGVERAFDWRIVLISEMVVASHRTRVYDLVRRSLQYDFWSDTSLEQLRSWLEEPIDYETRWQDAIDAELAMGMIEMESPIVGSDQVGVNLYPFGVSAQAKLRFLDTMMQQRNVPGAGSREHVIRVGKINDQFREHTGWVGFTITGIPVANAEFTTDMYRPVQLASAAAFARWEAERKWTRTAVALRQFRLRNDRWPADLSELAEVGVAPSVWLATGTIPLGYRVSEDGSEAILWNANLDSWTSGGEVSAEPPTEREAGSGSLDAVLLKLR